MSLLTAREIELDNLQRSLPVHYILWFCDISKNNSGSQLLTGSKTVRSSSAEWKSLQNTVRATKGRRQRSRKTPMGNLVCQFSLNLALSNFLHCQDQHRMHLLFSITTASGRKHKSSYLHSFKTTALWFLLTGFTHSEAFPASKMETFGSFHIWATRSSPFPFRFLSGRENSVTTSTSQFCLAWGATYFISDRKIKYHRCYIIISQHGTG